jgi:X-X-X-Leu-X-X-Gly heptad repeat protein
MRVLFFRRLGSGQLAVGSGQLAVGSGQYGAFDVCEYPENLLAVKPRPLSLAQRIGGRLARWQTPGLFSIPLGAL